MIGRREVEAAWQRIRPHVRRTPVIELPAGSFGVAAPLYRTPSGDCLSVNCGIPSFRFSAEQIERECGPRILGLARSIKSLVANA